MITLYHAPRSRSFRVRWLLEELGVEHEVVTMQFGPQGLGSADYRKVHPLGKVPVIHEEGLVMFESGAIVEYLLERYGEGRLQPAPGAPERPAYLQWLHYAEATLMPPLGDIAQHSFLRPEERRIPALVPDATARAHEVLGVVEEALEGRDHLAGAFSAADVMMGYGLMLAKLFQLLGDATPGLAAYLERLEARPAWQRAMA